MRYHLPVFKHEKHEKKKKIKFVAGWDARNESSDTLCWKCKLLWPF